MGGRIKERLKLEKVKWKWMTLFDIMVTEKKREKEGILGNLVDFMKKTNLKETKQAWKRERKERSKSKENTWPSSKERSKAYVYSSSVPQHQRALQAHLLHTPFFSFLPCTCIYLHQLAPFCHSFIKTITKRYWVVALFLPFSPFEGRREERS